MKHTATFVFLAVLAGCNSASSPGKPGPEIDLNQNWSHKEKEFFWFTSQGSRMIPYSWFLHLEQASNQEQFRDPWNMERFRFIPAGKSSLNPDALPIGFAKDPARDGADRDYVGPTCALCHTAKLQLRDRTVIVEGAPAMIDFQTFLAELDGALAATAADDAKFGRFADKVLGPGAPDAKKAALRAEVKSEHEGLSLFRPRPGAPLYGFARFDAFEHIFLRLSAQIIRSKNGMQMPENANPPYAPRDLAPVSYPFLWDTPQHDRVQWNGFAKNSPRPIGALLRNIGECVGVFGRMDIRSPLPWIKSSIRKGNLLDLEEKIETLWSPKWPREIFGIDLEKAKEGRALYRNNCEACHPIIRRDDPGRKIEAKVSDQQTDPQMWTNFQTRTARSGVLKGAFKPPIKEVEQAGTLLDFAVFGVLLRPGKSLAESISDAKRQFRDEDLTGLITRADKNGYKARPLNGIWASAPYLHNGSVPTLRALLTPVKERKPFWVGSRVFNEKDVGFVSTESPGTFYLDTSLKGNLNTGHEHGTELAPDRKDQLIEFLKIVGEE